MKQWSYDRVKSREGGGEEERIKEQNEGFGVRVEGMELREDK